jgi:hypothetical protein
MEQHFLHRCEKLHTFALGNKCKIYVKVTLKTVTTFCKTEI